MGVERADFNRGDLLSAYFNIGRRTALTLALVTVAVLAVADWLIIANVSVGILYVIPILIAAAFLSRTQNILACIGCSFLKEMFAPAAWQSGSTSRLVIGFLAYLGGALFVQELGRNRKVVYEYAHQVAEQVKLRKDAEEQLRILVESSPAAILTADSDGRVLLANEAAHRLLSSNGQPLSGQDIRTFLPVLGDLKRTGRVSAQFYRTATQCTARRGDGKPFFASLWFSTYNTESGPRLAAIVVDASEDLRDREELNLHQLLTSTRILVGAVSHEIRNLCGAISVVHANLGRVPQLATNEDYNALGNLVQGLSRLASAELRPIATEALTRVDLQSTFDQLRVVTDSWFQESSALVEWKIPDRLPLVWADPHGLLQVFLNLSKNSLRAMEQANRRVLTISVHPTAHNLIIRFHDSGPGLASPDHLFKPLQPGVESVGLGLYVSRAIVRRFRGDLRYEPSTTGCCFAVELATSSAEGDVE